MKLFVKGSRNFAVDTTSESNVQQLKALIQDQEGTASTFDDAFKACSTMYSKSASSACFAWTLATKLSMFSVYFNLNKEFEMFYCIFQHVRHPSL